MAQALAISLCPEESATLALKRHVLSTSSPKTMYLKKRKSSYIILVEFLMTILILKTTFRVITGFLASNFS